MKFFTFSLIIPIALSGCCNLKISGQIPSEKSEKLQSYTNNAFKFSFKYPASWQIKQEGFNHVILIPSAEAGWKPETPADLSGNPEITIECGEYVRERLGPKWFPQTVSHAVLKKWLNESENAAVDETVIDGFQALETVELYEGPHRKTLYWRTDSLKNLIRVSTASDNPY